MLSQLYYSDMEKTVDEFGTIYLSVPRTLWKNIQVVPVPYPLAYPNMSEIERPITVWVSNKNGKIHMPGIGPGWWTVNADLVK